MYDLATIESAFRTDYLDLIDKYGNESSIPKDERFLVNETLRAQYVVIGNDGIADPAVLRQYSIAPRVIEAVCGEKAGAPERKIRNADKRKTMENWCDDNIGVTVTPQTLAEIGDVSYATAISFINERVDMFFKVKRGFYLIRDYKAERLADKKR
jgi:hypothetical protein